MKLKYLRIAFVCSAAALAAHGQTVERRAMIAGGGNPNEGRCVVEVMVDGTAEIEIRRDNLVLRNLKGQMPDLRRFECSSPLPGHPMNLRFAGLQGRGKQELLQAPDGGAIAVRIDDPQNGVGNYAFELRWNGEMAMPQGAPPMATMPMGRRYRFGTDDAIKVCQVAVRDRAERRFGAEEIAFRRAVMDDQPGRSEWVKGFFESRSRSGEPRNFTFNCQIDFATELVRSVDVQPMERTEGAFGNAGADRAIKACEVFVEQKLIQDGFRRADFSSVRVDDRPGRNDWIVGAVTTLDRDRPTWFDFSCSADLQSGTVRSADVTRR